VKGAVYDGTEWSYAGASSGTNTATGTTADAAADFTGTNFFGKVMVQAFLQGAFNTGTGMMSTTLPNDPEIEPLMLTSPYADAPASVMDIPAGVTDWVKLELRDPASPTTILGKASAFIKNDGMVVGLDGASVPLVKNGNPTSVVALFHRSHLGIRTVNAGIDVINPTLHNFSTSLSQAYDNAPPLVNESMAPLGTTGLFGLWRGNVSGDLLINAVDLAQLKPQTNPSQSNVYSRFDVNLDGLINATDLAQCKANSNPSKTAHIN